MTNKELAEHVVESLDDDYRDCHLCCAALQRLRSMPEPEAVAEAITLLDELAVWRQDHGLASKYVDEVIAKLKGNP